MAILQATQIGTATMERKRTIILAAYSGEFYEFQARATDTPPKAAMVPKGTKAFYFAYRECDPDVYRPEGFPVDQWGINNARDGETIHTVDGSEWGYVLRRNATFRGRYVYGQWWHAWRWKEGRTAKLYLVKAKARELSLEELRSLYPE